MGEKGTVRCHCERDAHESEPPVVLTASSHIDVGRFIPKVGTESYPFGGVCGWDWAEADRR
jgi:hypothetical protein